jgi:ribosome biogenesis GTPase
MLIDTPGMRELGLLGTSDVMEATFGDVGDCSGQCRFPDCTHTREPGCAVLTARESGRLSEERYQSYLKLKKEVDHCGLSSVEKRRKDRAFGRFVKSSMKYVKK